MRVIRHVEEHVQEWRLWQEPVTVFDYNVRQGAFQCAYANPMHYRVPGQGIIGCFAMRCPIAFRNSEESQTVAAFSADGG